jgi:hypothetical protein
MLACDSGTRRATFRMVPNGKPQTGQVHQCRSTQTVYHGRVRNNDTVILRQRRYPLHHMNSAGPLFTDMELIQHQRSTQLNIKGRGVTHVKTYALSQNHACELVPTGANTFYFSIHDS